MLEYFREQVAIGEAKEQEWNDMFARYKEAYPKEVCVGYDGETLS